MVDFDSGDLTIFANWKMDENGPWKSIIYADLLPGLPIYPPWIPNYEKRCDFP